MEGRKPSRVDIAAVDHEVPPETPRSICTGGTGGLDKMADEYDLPAAAAELGRWRGGAAAAPDDAAREAAATGGETDWCSMRRGQGPVIFFK